MIFLTVGTQLPFERLVSAVDDWAGNHPGEKVFMQTGDVSYQPKNADFSAFTAPDQWEALFAEAELVISHAGMGTLLRSLDIGKPLIIMPRLASLGEHRNDHQLATAERFDRFENVRVVRDVSALVDALNSPPSHVSATSPDSNLNLSKLINALRDFSGLEHCNEI